MRRTLLNRARRHRTLPQAIVQRQPLLRREIGGRRFLQELGLAPRRLSNRAGEQRLTLPPAAIPEPVSSTGERMPAGHGEMAAPLGRSGIGRPGEASPVGAMPLPVVEAPAAAASGEGQPIQAGPANRLTAPEITPATIPAPAERQPLSRHVQEIPAHAGDAAMEPRVDVETATATPAARSSSESGPPEEAADRLRRSSEGSQLEDDSIRPPQDAGQQKDEPARAPGAAAPDTPAINRPSSNPAPEAAELPREAAAPPTALGNFGSPPTQPALETSPGVTTADTASPPFVYAAKEPAPGPAFAPVPSAAAGGEAGATPPWDAARPSMAAARPPADEAQELSDPGDLTSSDQLFLPSDADRSPQAWLARLRGGSAPRPAADHRPQDEFPSAPADHLADAAQPGPPAASFAPPGQPIARSAPVSEPARRFLQPLVGIDPASVPVYRGPEVDRVLEALPADAAAVGEAVLMPTNQPEDMPEALGLLAHELTHVARQRQPRFVPPVVQLPPRTRPAPGSVLTPEDQAASVGPGSAAPPEPPAAEIESAGGTSAEEESLALHVEARVRSAARDAIPRQFPSVPLDSDGASPGPAPGRLAEQDSARAARPPDPPAIQHPWGGLPAPWEPLPAWVTTAPSPVAAPGPGSIAAPAPVLAAPIPSAMETLPINLASPDREVEAGAAPAATATEAPPDPTTPHQHSPEPDLDLLARQVYAVLKRRLAAERRREG